MKFKKIFRAFIGLLLTNTFLFTNASDFSLLNSSNNTIYFSVAPDFAENIQSWTPVASKKEFFAPIVSGLLTVAISKNRPQSGSDLLVFEFHKDKNIYLNFENDGKIAPQKAKKVSFTQQTITGHSLSNSVRESDWNDPKMVTKSRTRFAGVKLPQGSSKRSSR